MRFRLYIFDLDGTLLDTRRDLTTAVNEMLAALGMEPKSLEEVVGYVGDGIRRLVERSLGGDSTDLERAERLFRKAYEKHLVDATVPYPGVVETLQMLDRSHKAVFTNKSDRLTARLLEELGIRHFFSVVVGGDAVKQKKPSPEGIEYILEKTGVRPEDAVMIGDHRNDILAAQNAGVRSVFVTYGFSRLENVLAHNPDHVIKSPGELLTL
ncbi:MAG: HAD family hydrolase [Spirochaetota bacterium]